MKTWGFLNTRIGRRLLALLLASSLLPLITMGWFAIDTSEAALRRQNFAVLRASSNAAEAQLREFLFYLKQSTLALSDDSRIHDALAQQDPVSGHSNLTLIADQLEEILNRQQNRLPEALELFVMDARGRVIASSDRTRIGKQLASAIYFFKGQSAFFSGEVTRDFETGRVSWILSAPVRDRIRHRSLGVVALCIDPGALNALTSGQRLLAQGADTQSFRMGNTGETYIVDSNGLLITESRDFTNAILNRKIDTLPIRAALERGEEITADYTDYRGVQVSGASAIIHEMGWTVLTEIDFSQAFSASHRLRSGLVALAIGLGCLVTVLAWRSARWVIRPLQLLKASDLALAAGDRVAALVPEQNLPADELGEFIRLRNARVKSLFERQQQLMIEQERRADLAAELEHMSYSIIHDMRAPLRAIISFEEMIESSATARLDTQDVLCLRRMKTAALRMDRLIVDVLNYSRVVRGELNLHPVDVAGLLRGMIETYPFLQPLKKQIHVAEDLPLVQGNEAALTQCFSNLLENAVKYSQPGRTPQIRIDGENHHGWVRIWVQDNGVGIPEPFQKRLFGVFQRGHDSRGGTGIGLAIVRKTVERMGGRVGVLSQEDHGSRFWIELKPADPPADDQYEARPAAPAIHSSKAVEVARRPTDRNGTDQASACCRA